MDLNNDSSTLTKGPPEHRDHPEDTSAVLRVGNAMISQMVAMEKLLKIYN